MRELAHELTMPHRIQGEIWSIRSLQIAQIASARRGFVCVTWKGDVTRRVVTKRMLMMVGWVEVGGRIAAARAMLGKSRGWGI